MKETKHISELIDEIGKEAILKQVKSNQYKMEYMAKHHGNRYFEMFENLIMENYSIQDAIDKCYEYFTR